MNWNIMVWNIILVPVDVIGKSPSSNWLQKFDHTIRYRNCGPAMTISRHIPDMHNWYAEHDQLSPHALTCYIWWPIVSFHIRSGQLLHQLAMVCQVCVKAMLNLLEYYTSTHDGSVDWYFIHLCFHAEYFCCQCVTLTSQLGPENLIGHRIPTALSPDTIDTPSLLYLDEPQSLKSTSLSNDTWT